MKKLLFLTSITIAMFFVAGCVINKPYQNSATLNGNEKNILCNKEKNCCTKDEDCQYVWFTGACNTPEYVAKIQKENESNGLRNIEAPSRDNVTCTCGNAKCVTRN
jgi:hypothetical protein